MKTIKKIREHQYEREMLNTEHNKVSRGAEFIDKVITFPKGDNWRRKQNVKKHGKNK